MILIFSSENDQSTSDVIDWLLFYKKDFLRFNRKIEIGLESIHLANDQKDIVVTINGKPIALNTIDSVWYRRGFFVVSPNEEVDQTPYKNYLKIEKEAVLHFFIQQLECKEKVSNYTRRDMNKLIQLEAAKKAGLFIPDTLLTKNKQTLSRFMSVHSQVITKSIQGQLMVVNGPIAEQLYTENFTSEDFRETDESFGASKFQAKVDKAFELRVFVFENTFYAMAIFSQRNTKTETDFRNYDTQVPNRCVPFDLPASIKIKIRHFMKELRLMSGSIDLICDKQGNYIFLEVNPVGQFGMVSYPCHYPIEKHIATTL